MSSGLLFTMRFPYDRIENMVPLSTVTRASVQEVLDLYTKDGTPVDTGWDDAKSTPVDHVLDAIKRMKESIKPRPKPVSAGELDKAAGARPFPDWMLEQWAHESKIRRDRLRDAGRVRKMTLPPHTYRQLRKAGLVPAPEGPEVFIPAKHGQVLAPPGHCDYCSGTGRFVPFALPETDCPKCKGSGRVNVGGFVNPGFEMRMEKT